MVTVCRFRATGVIDPSKRHAVIPFPDGTRKLLATSHNKLRNGGGWSFFRCPRCDRRCNRLWAIDGAPLCSECCAKANVHSRARMGFGREERLRARQLLLDREIAKLETTTPLRFKTPAVWGGRNRMVSRVRALTANVRRRIVALRLKQLSTQQAGRGIDPLVEAKRLVDFEPIWRAKTLESLEKALDQAQLQILAALHSDDPQARLDAAKLMLRTPYGRRLTGIAARNE